MAPLNPYDLFDIYSLPDLGKGDETTPHTDFYGALEEHRVSYRPDAGFPPDTSGQVAIIYRSSVLGPINLEPIMERKIQALNRAAQELHEPSVGEALARTSETLRQVLDDGTERIPKPLGPQEELRKRINTWWGWFVDLLNNYDGLCSDIVGLASDFFYDFSESYRQETNYQSILQALANQGVAVHELGGLLSERQLHEAQNFSYDPTYQNYLRYIQSIHNYKRLVEIAQSAVASATRAKQQEFNFHYAQIQAIVDNHESRPRMLDTLMNTLGIPESFFKNVEESKIDPRLNLGLKEKFDEVFSEPYGFLPWVQKYHNHYLYIVLKNPAYQLPDNPIQYFVLYELHEEDTFPDSFSWKLCTIQGDATARPDHTFRGFKGFKRYSLIAPNGTYLLNTLEERPPECDEVHAELIAAVARAREVVLQSQADFASV